MKTSPKKAKTNPIKIKFLYFLFVNSPFFAAENPRAINKKLEIAFNILIAKDTDKYFAIFSPKTDKNIKIKIILIVTILSKFYSKIII